jgi:hypothetical protein
MTTQLTLWNVVPLAKKGWDDIRLPDAYYSYYEAHQRCPNCRVKLRHPLHALNHYRKFHMLPQHRFFVWKFGLWNEIPQTAYLKAREKHFATARTK